MDTTVNARLTDLFPKFRSEVLALEYVKLHSSPEQTPEQFAKAYIEAEKRIARALSSRD